MSIRSFSLSNFKGIKQKCQVDLRPITLLFGANSSGKSSIIQGLLFAFETFYRSNLDPRRTFKGGKSVDLGGFRNLLHGHDRSQPMTIRIDLEPTNSAPTIAAEDPEFEAMFEDRWNVSFRTYSVELKIQWSDRLERPLVVSYSVEADNFPIGKIEICKDQKMAAITEINFGHPIFLPSRKAIEEMLQEINEHLAEWDLEPIEIRTSGLSGGNFSGGYELWQEGKPASQEMILELCTANLLGESFARELDSVVAREHFLKGNRVNIPVLLEDTAMPERGPLIIHDSVWKTLNPLPPSLAKSINELYDDRNINTSIEWTPQKLTLREVASTLSQIFAGSRRLVASALDKLLYLGPLREIPPRAYELPKFPEAGRWASGLGAWDELHEDRDSLVENTSQELVKLGAGYRLRKRRYKKLDLNEDLAQQLESEEALNALENLRDQLMALPEEEVLTLTAEKSGVELSLRDVGTGISQVIPVVVAAVKKGPRVLAFEQPELHLHPAQQVELGDLFIRHGTRESDPNVFLVETHSEHLVLRLLRRIRETAEGETSPGSPSLIPEQISVLWVAEGSDGVVVKPLRVDETGEFIDNWPSGFFEERAEELFS